MSSITSMIEGLFAGQQSPREGEACLEALAELFSPPPPKLLFFVSHDGILQGLRQSEGAPFPEDADSVAWEVAQHVARGDDVFRLNRNGHIVLAFGLRPASPQLKLVLGGVFAPGRGDEPTLRSTLDTIRRSESLLETAFTLSVKVRTTEKRLEQLRREHDVLQSSRADAVELAIQEQEQRLRGERERLASDAAAKARSEFLANMSHEIRTPLNAILGFAELLLKSGERGEHNAPIDQLQTIVDSGQHLLELINDILDLSKIEAGRMRMERIRCNPAQVVSRVLSLLRVRAIEKGLDLTCEWPDGVPASIQTDPTRLQQLLVNLVGNAVKFTEKGSVRIVVRLTGEPETRRMAFDVIDTGVGIARENLEKIFDAFSQADTSVTRKFGGTGLGLAICRRIADGLNGELTVRSEVGKGSVFTATIDPGPLEGVEVVAASNADGFAPRHAAKADEEVRIESAKVLLVEDGETNRKLAELILNRAGATVVSAENGAVGVELARKDRYDVILMDMQMPVMDGYTATQRLRELNVDVPIIALTAHAMSNDVGKCLDAGCDGYLSKPVESHRLLSTIAGFLTAGSRSPQETETTESAAPADERVEPPTPEKCDSVAQTLPDEPLGSASRLDQAAASRGEPLVSTLPLDDADFRAIVNEFIETCREKVATMHALLQEQDFDQLARAAHWLKGSGGSAGFEPLMPAAAELEDSAKQQAANACTASLQKIDELVARLQRAEPPAFQPG